MNILDQFSSSGKWAFVTERKRRIGKAIVLALAEVGADIIGFSPTLELNGCKDRSVSESYLLIVLLNIS